jgi:dihydrofolate reductase
LSIGIIVAVAKSGVIGIDGKIPWRHPADMKRFKEVTTGHTVIMGRKTYESMGKPLPNRRNIVVTRAAIAGVECVPSLAEALALVKDDAFIIGGARLYAEGMAHADFLDVTLVPDDVPRTPDAVVFPEIDSRFEAGPEIKMDEGMTRRVYRRKM